MINYDEILKVLSLKEILQSKETAVYDLPGSIKKYELEAIGENEEKCLIDIRYAFDDSYLKQDLIDFFLPELDKTVFKKRYIVYYYFSKTEKEVTFKNVPEQFLMNNPSVAHVYVPTNDIDIEEIKIDFDKQTDIKTVNETLLSVIVPTFNSGNYIEQVLQTVVNQIGFPEKEIIIVDALSTDTTIEIAQEYCGEKDIIISEKDNGIFDAINKGTKLSNGKYSLFLGSDDFLISRSLLEFKKGYYENPDKDFYFGDIYTLRYKELLPKKAFITLPEYGKFNIAHPALFIRKTAFLDVKGFNTDYKVCSDADFELKLITSDKTYSKIETYISVFRSGGFSDLNPQKIREAVRIYKYHKAMNIKYRIQSYKFYLLWFYRKYIKQ